MESLSPVHEEEEQRFFSHPKYRKTVVWEIENFSRFLSMSHDDIEKCGISFEAVDASGKLGAWDFSFRIKDKDDGEEWVKLQPCVQPKQGSHKVKADFSYQMISGENSREKEKMKDDTYTQPLLLGYGNSSLFLKMDTHQDDKLAVVIDVELDSGGFTTIDKASGEEVPNIEGYPTIGFGNKKVILPKRGISAKQIELWGLSGDIGEEKVFWPRKEPTPNTLNATTEKVEQENAEAISEIEVETFVFLQKDYKPEIPEEPNQPSEKAMDDESEYGDLLLKIPQGNGFFTKKVFKSTLGIMSSKFLSAICPNGNETEVVLDEISATGLEAFLTHTYSPDFVLPEWITVAEEVLNFAEKYDLPRFRQVCENNIILITSAENVTQMYKLAKKFHLEKAKEKTVNYIFENAKAVMNQLVK